ncbi:MAG: Ig-like domain-containing protein [Prevotella sp.]|nr:Ig-like domain-containing protein [Prevotella sp.]
MKQKLFRLMLAVAAVLTLGNLQAASKKVHTIGDSTQEQRATDGSTDKRGWTQMLQQFIDASQFTINNRGKSGASSKSYYQEAPYWNSLKTGGSDQMSAGDLLIIQFAHNDEKTSGSDGDEVKAFYTAQGKTAEAAAVDYRGTTPWGTYKEYLRKYINEAKAMGVKPILVGAICRGYFKDNGNKNINAAGQHNLWQKYNYIDKENNTYVENAKLATDDHTMDYTYQMAQVAAEYDDVPFVNLTEGTKELLESLGEEYCVGADLTKRQFFCKDDATHPALIGATLIARKFAQMVKDQAETETNAAKKAVLQELAAAVVIENEISFTPKALHLGDAYIGTYAKGEVNISAFGLTPSTGTVTVSADNDFEVSADGNAFAGSATFSYSGATLISTIYVRKKIATVGEQKCSITVTDGTNTKTVDVSVNGLSVTTGTETSLVWPLTAGISATENALFTAFDETLTGMEIKNYADVSGIKMQRLMPTGTAWPGGEIDEVSTRYVEFKASIPAGKTFYMDNISFNIAGLYAGDFGMHAYFATNSSFSDAALIAEYTNMTGNSIIPVSKDVMKTLEEGETIYIRIYPWKAAAAASGKYIGLSEMTIHGIMANKTSDATTFGIGREFKSENVFEDGLEKVMGTAPTGVTFEQCSTAFSSTKTDQTLKHGAATPTYTGGTTIRNLHNNAAVQNAFVDGFYWGFKVSIPEGYFMSVSQMYSDVYGVKNTLTSKFVVKASLDGANIYESETHAANVENGGAACQYTLDATNIKALQELTGEVYFLMPWFSGSGATYYALKDFNITATLTQDVPTTKYALTTSVLPAEAGRILTNPESASYKEGTEVTLTTVRNFGYKFKEWQMDGTTVSTDAQYKVTMDADKQVTAVFEQVPTYTINTKVSTDADMSIGSITLTPNEHNNMYEEGEEVVATANTSKILKFINWEDNTTANPRAITVDKEMTITAHYEVQDFIAVFDDSKVGDVYDRDGSGFAADITWDTERNAKVFVVKVSDGNTVYTQSTGTPVVRNRPTAVVTGLGGLYQNGYNTREIAWQYQFSTKKFTSAKFSGQMAAKNGATLSYKAMISTDGTTFTDIPGATLSFTAAESSTIKDYEFDLPADAMDKELIYIRITGIGDEVFNSNYKFDKGTFCGLDYTDHSETGVGNVYILGSAEEETDAEAPVVTSKIPAEGATGVSASGRITISYDERIQAGAGDGLATLNGQPLNPIWSSRSVSFDYFNLTYGQQYTFSMPAAFVQDKSGNQAEAVTITFTVMERQQPTARTFDAIVDQSLEVAKIDATADMPAQYKKIQDAINDAPTTNSKPYLIYIKEGYYNDPNETFDVGMRGYRYANPADDKDNTTVNDVPSKKNQYDDCRLVYVNKPNIHLIGQAVDKVTIAGDRLDGGAKQDRTRVWYHVSAGATLEVQAGGKDFYMENITVDNENWTKQKWEGPQALCMNISADRAVFNNVNVRSYQDTYYAGGDVYNRQYWQNSTLEGGVDYIYGNGCDVFFESCIQNINRKTGGYIVAPSHPANTRWGYVFNNNIITSTYFTPEEGRVYLGRPWHENPKTVFLHTQMEVGAYEGYWYETMGGIPALWAVYDIWDKNGNKMSEVSREDYWYMDGNVKVEGKAKNSLTDEEAAQYTLANVMAGDGTSNTETGVWNPLPIVEKTATPVLTAVDGGVTWDAVPYAICYVVTVNDKPVAFPTDTKIEGLKKDDVVSVQAVNEYGALSEMSAAVTISNATGIQTVGSHRSTSTMEAVYSLDGKRLQHMQRGLNIVKMSDGRMVKMIYK